MAYPLKFKTIYKDKIWGGNKIKKLLNKDYGDLPKCGETWELSAVPGDISVVSNGLWRGQDLKSLLVQHGAAIMGVKLYEKFGIDFPLLIKFIDANQDLSIQVHPDDALAKKRNQGSGKTEMWYVLQADAQASLITGFNQPMSQEVYLEKFESENLMEILNQEQVAKGDVFFLPAGRIHTIGKGLLIAEIQQTSDVTYRIHDFAFFLPDAIRTRAIGRALRLRISCNDRYVPSVWIRMFMRPSWMRRFKNQCFRGSHGASFASPLPPKEPPVFLAPFRPQLRTTCISLVILIRAQHLTGIWVCCRRRRRSRAAMATSDAGQGPRQPGSSPGRHCGRADATGATSLRLRLAPRRLLFLEARRLQGSTR